MAAPVGVGFLRLLGAAGHRWRKVPIPWRSALGGLACGAILPGLPMAAGNGFEPLEALLDGKLAVGMVLWRLLVKPVATAMAVGSGNPGGAFTPTLLIGGCSPTLLTLDLRLHPCA